MSDIYARAVELARKDGRITVPKLQRTFRIGYRTACGIIERMTFDGLIGALKNGAYPYLPKEDKA